MSVVAQFTTVQGDMPDWISYQVYGNERYSPLIISANQSQIGVMRFDAGTVLQMPVVQIGTNISPVPWGQLYKK